MQITVQDINKLRQRTSAGIMDCKKALIESNGDFEKAIDIIRKKGQKVSLDRADKVASEGKVFIKTNSDATYGIAVSLSSETDFVSQNENFTKLGELIVEKAMKEKPANIESLYQAKADSNLTIKDKITELVGKVGEKIEITDYQTISGNLIVTYIHPGDKLGVLLSIDGAVDKAKVTLEAKAIAMQIAAMNPIALRVEGVPQEIIDKELEIAKEKAELIKKPQEIIDKILKSQVNTFLKENTLENQSFVKDNSITVKQYVSSIEKNLVIKDYKRISI